MRIEEFKRKEETRSTKTRLKHQKFKIECLDIRTGELYLETIPQLTNQFATLSPESIWQSGWSFIHFIFNLKFIEFLYMQWNSGS